LKATEKFTGKADIYSKNRPNYPIEYINYLISYNSLTSESAIADIGSGTGILSKQFLEKKLKVMAVEPNKDMRIKAEQLLNTYSGFISIEGTAEDTTLQDNSII
jgi:16S rRNA A1518/A1519 N6-dimethyltransferase RsmA/KsgA/DIM1 with predicted DNA glycosylase/AP lyase activity